MKTISLQFQPNRATKVSISSTSELMLQVALAHKDVRQFTIKRGGVSRQYINYLFVSRGVRSIWRAIYLKVLHHRQMGPALRRACIVTAEGSRGWDNYVLLHHFDPRQKLDQLSCR
jgi:hypothetical protein